MTQSASRAVHNDDSSSSFPFPIQYKIANIKGRIEIIKESYLTLEEEGLTSILSRSPSIITRLKGKEAILSRLEHLYSLGLTKEDVMKLPSVLVRYSDEEILRLQSVPRRNRK